MADDGADFRQQEELDEFQQYLIDAGIWFKEQNDKFNEIFGVDDGTSKDSTSTS